jgi:hypothetical protein
MYCSGRYSEEKHTAGNQNIAVTLRIQFCKETTKSKLFLKLSWTEIEGTASSKKGSIMTLGATYSSMLVKEVMIHTK